MVPASASTGAAAKNNTSYGRRRHSRASAHTVTSAQPNRTTTVRSKYSTLSRIASPDPNARVSQAVTCITAPVRTGYSSGG